MNSKTRAKVVQKKGSQGIKMLSDFKQKSNSRKS